MKNTDIFATVGYDMVVAVTQKSINDQLKRLADPDIGVIKTSLIVSLDFDESLPDGGDYVAKIWDNFSDVPKDKNGKPQFPVINAQYLPSIDVPESGTVVDLVLTFISGDAYFRDPVNQVMRKFNMAGWMYGITMQLDFAGIAAADLKAGKAIPDNVAQNLEKFTTEQFKVSQLFLDFESTDLLRFDPNKTGTGTAGGAIRDLFVLFMGNYLGSFAKDPIKNPYILGYAIKCPPPDVDPNADVPSSLKPVGNTFTVYKDPGTAVLNTVNFVMNTLGGSGQISAGDHSTPGIFDTNWIDPTEKDSDGKMVYSPSAFLEKLILQKFYQVYSSNLYATFHSSGLNIDTPPPYSTAKSQIDHGFGFTISAKTGTDDDYQNSYTVTWPPNTSGGFDLKFVGEVSFKKTKRKDLGFGNEAVAWCQGTQPWTSTMSFVFHPDDNGHPTLKVNDPVLNDSGAQQSTGKNSFAAALGEISDIFGGLLDIVLTLGQTHFFQDTFENLLTEQTPGLPSVDVSVGSLFTATKNTFMLPAGDIFFFKNASILNQGSLTMELKYKADDGSGESTTSRLAVRPKRAAVTNGLHGNLRRSAPKDILTASSLTSVKPTQRPTSRVSTNSSSESPPVDLGTALMDRISLKGIGASQSQSIDATVSCELMNNSQSAMPVAPTGDMVALQTVDERPMILSIGTDQKLNALIYSSGTTNNGWTAIDVLDDFPTYTKATGFDAAQNAAGQISVCFSLIRADNSNVDVFLASMLSNDLSVTNWGKLSKASKQIQGLDPGFVVDSIRLGLSDDGQPPLVTMEGSVGSTHTLYQITGGSQQAVIYALPENVDPGRNGLLGHQMGYAFSQRANYLLYTVDGSKQLIAQSIADQNGGVLDYDFSRGNVHLPVAFRGLDYNCIHVATSRVDNTHPASDLYIGAQGGVYRIPNTKNSAMENVTDGITSVRSITSTINGDAISLWVLSGQGSLWYIYGKRQTGTTTIAWNRPISFRSNVLAVTGIRSTNRNANEIFVLGQDFTITHYWQDPDSTLWKQQTASVGEDGYIINYESYTTHLHFESKGLPLAANLKITSSDWQYYIINGLTHSLDPDAPTEIPLDYQGNMTLIAAAADLSPTTLHLQCDQFAETLNIYPNGKVHHHLQAVTDGNALQSATDQNGKPVLGSDITPDVVNGVAANISTIRSYATTQYPPSKQGNVFTDVEQPATQSSLAVSKSGRRSMSSKISTSHLANDFAAGFGVQDGRFILHTADSARGKVAQISSTKALFSFDDFTHFPGDIWHHLESLGGSIVHILEDTETTLSDGVHFIISKVDDVLQFVVTIGEQVIKLAMDTLALAYKAMNYLFSLIKLGLKELLAWIGHLLGWDHIWKTHKMIAQQVTALVEHGSDNSTRGIESLRALSKTGFDKIIDDARQFILPDSIKNKTGPVNLSQAAAQSGSASLSTPQGNYAFYHFANPSGRDVDNLPKNTTDSPAKTATAPAAGDPFTQFLNDVVSPLGQTIKDKFTADGVDFVDLLKNRDMDSLRVLAFGMTDTLLSVFETLVDGLLKFAEDLISDLKGVLEEEINIPVIKQLYEWLTALLGDGESFTAINAFSFLMAIPLVTIWRAATNGDSPDQHGSFIPAAEAFKLIADFISAGSSTASALSQANGQPPVPELHALMNGKASTKLTSRGEVHPSAKLLDVAASPSMGDKDWTCPQNIKDWSAISGGCAAGTSVVETIIDLAKLAVKAGEKKDGEGGAVTAPVEGPIVMSKNLLSTLAKGFEKLLVVCKIAFTVPYPSDGEQVFWYVFRVLWQVATDVWEAACAILDVDEKMEELGDLVFNGLALFVGLIVDGVEWGINSSLAAETLCGDMMSSLGGVGESLGVLMKNPIVEGLGLVVGGGAAGLVLSNAIKAGSGDKVWKAVNVGGI